MPRMTAPQMFWTGAGVLLLGVVFSFGYQSMMFDYAFGLRWFYRFVVVGGGVLVTLGATLAVGGLVVGALQRGAAPARPQTPYPPQPAYGAPPSAAPQPYPVHRTPQPLAPQQPYLAPQPYPAPPQLFAPPQPPASGVEPSAPAPDPAPGEPPR